MQIVKTQIEGCFEITPRVFEDKRGYFFESFNKEKFEAATGITINFVQDNQSLSGFGVLRGLHFQTGDHAQAKLVRVLEGEVLDVAVDLRPNSPTYKKVVTSKLSEENKRQLFIPRGCAHGFVTLSKTAVFSYKCDNYYHPASETGIYYADLNLKIDWLLEQEDFIISDKDLVLPTLEQYEQKLHSKTQNV